MKNVPSILGLTEVIFLEANNCQKMKRLEKIQNKIVIFIYL